MSECKGNCNCKICKIIAVILVLLLGAVIGYYETKSCPFASNGPVGDDDVVIAVVGGENVYLSEVIAFHDSNPQLKNVPIESVYKELLNYITESKALLSAAKEAGIKDTEHFKKNAKESLENVARAVYVEAEIDKIVTEDKLKELYAEYIKANPGEEEVRASHILVDSESAAKDIIKDINDGADFAEVAREKSKDANGANGGDLGYFKKSAMVPEFADAAFAMQVNEVSKKPVKTMFGWHVVKVTDRRHAAPTPFEVIKGSLRMQQAQTIVPEIVKKARESAKIELKPEAYKNKIINLVPEAPEATEAPKAEEASATPAQEATPAPEVANEEVVGSAPAVETVAEPAPEAEVAPTTGEASEADEDDVEIEVEVDEE